MENLLDYLRWRGDLSFDQSGFTAVDGAILARLAYLPFDGVPLGTTLGEAAAQLLSLPEWGFSENDALLLTLLTDSPRFSVLRLRSFVDRLDEQTQFSALTVELSPEAWYISFRGTDNTLVGWKEDFNMSFVCPVPAQRLAVEYCKQIAGETDAKLLLGGHSKGGNLAVYAAAFCGEPVQRRIRTVFNFDGPGFDEQVLASDGYRRICERVQTLVPQSSVVGMLLGHEECYTIVRSNQTGILQHNLYSWELLRDDFVRLEQVDNGSRFLDATLKTWLKEMDAGQRATFVDTICDVLVQTNAKTTREMSENWLHSAISITRSVKNLDDDTRRAVTHALSLLFKSAGHSLTQVMQTRGT